MSRRRGILSAMLVIGALVLSACAGLPMSGPVNPGLSAGEDAGSPEFLFRPDEPQPGASPEQIVEGFIRAGSGPGPAANWEVARMFLAPSIRETWNPEASVTIDLPMIASRSRRVRGRSRSRSRPSGASTEQARISPTRHHPAVVPTRPAGRRRMAHHRGSGRRCDRPRCLQRTSSTATRSATSIRPTGFLVPDVRWFPTTNAATRITRALVNGSPSSWLADAVEDAFPESVTLARPSVPLSPAWPR